jgi:hypothetical protein
MSPLVMWVLIVLGLIVALWYLKIEHNAHKVKIVIIIIIIIVLYFSIVRVFSSDEVDLSSPKGIINGLYVYVGWIGRTLGNLWDVGADTTGRVVEAVKINSTKEDLRK